MASKTRLYRVVSSSTQQVRLVEATTPAGARSHVARNEFHVDIPAQHEIYSLARQGIDIEVAGEGVVSDETRNAVAQEDLDVDAAQL